MSSKSRRPLTKRSAYANLTAIKEFLKECHRHGITVDPEVYHYSFGEDPKKGTKSIQIPHEKMLLILDNIEITKASDHRDYALIAAIYYACLTVSEALNLKTTDFINIKGSYYIKVITQSRSLRRECPDELVKILLEYIDALDLHGQGNMYLFPNSHGKSGQIYRTKIYQNSALWGMVNRRARQANIDLKISPSIIRSSGITKKIQDTGNLEFVSKYLGHSNAGTTAVSYTHLTLPTTPYV